MRRPPRPTPFPYTTLFRSVGAQIDVLAARLLRGHVARRSDDVPGGERAAAARHLRYAEVEQLPREAPVELAERSEEHTSELQSRLHLVCRLLLEKKKQMKE